MTLIIDGNNLAHREGYSKAGLFYQVDGKYVPTGAIMGFLQQLRNLTARFPGEVLVCWDSIKSLRREFHPDYKANRRDGSSKADPELVSDILYQMELLRTDILPRIGYPNQFQQDGYEADDLIAALCRRSKPTIIVSSDNDLYQLLGPSTSIWLLGKNVLMGFQDFQREYGVTPMQWVEVKAMAGDSSDNVVGVPGVGIKTAVKYLTVDDTSPKLNLKIAEHVDIILRNKKLIKLPWDGADPGEITRSFFNEREFMRVCGEYGLNRLMGVR